MPPHFGKKRKKLFAELQSATSPTEVPSWHHSSVAQRSGTVGRRMAGQPQSACKALQAATWQGFPTAESLSWQPGKAKQHHYHTAYIQSEPANKLSPVLKEKFQSHCPSTLNESVFHFPQILSVLLPEDTEGQCLKLPESRTNHTVSYHPGALREGDINFYDSTLNWHLPTGHVNILHPAQRFIWHQVSQKNDTHSQVHPHLQKKFSCNKSATASHKQTVFLTTAEDIQGRIFFFLLFVHFFLFEFY